MKTEKTAMIFFFTLNNSFLIFTNYTTNTITRLEQN